jgi:hypothetical protein
MDVKGARLEELDFTSARRLLQRRAPDFSLNFIAAFDSISAFAELLSHLALNIIDHQIFIEPTIPRK